MELQEKIKHAVVNSIAETDPVVIGLGDSGLARLLNALVSAEVIAVEDIDYSLDASLKKRALKDYKFLLREQKKNERPVYPDHDIYSEGLAYAISKGDIFTKTELGMIRFDHGQDAESFAERYRTDDLVPTLRDRLLHNK